MINEKEVYENEMAGLQTNMAEVKSQHGELGTSSDLISNKNEVLNTNIKEQESSIAVLQIEKDEVDVRCGAAIDENEAVREDNTTRGREEEFDECEEIF